jgi:nucleoside-triphosphatase THEP1
LARNDQKSPLKGADVLGKKTLIIGEAGAGKTTLAAKLLQELMTLVDPENITVIDLAPKRSGEIGGRIKDHKEISEKIRYLSPKNVYTPRLTGKSAEQITHFAELNEKNMEPLLERFVQNVTKVLIINDVTLYLHLGELENILKCAKLAETFLVTAYYGSKLADDLGTGISSRERQMIDKLSTFMDLVVRI